MKFSIVPAVFSLACVLFLTACNKNNKPLQVDRIKVIQGNNQCALPNEDFSQEVRLEIQGKVKKGVFGGKGERPPVAGAKILVQNIDSSKLRVSSQELTSDDGGGICFKIGAGNSVGDQYIKVIPVSAPEKSIILRFVSGVKIIGADQETKVNQKLPDPLAVQVVNSAGRALAGVPVYFSLASSPEKKNPKAAFKKNCVITNADGIATNQFKAGSKTGEYSLAVEIADPAHDFYVRGIRVRELGLDWLSLIVSVLGGLALFIFGMKLMSEGLQRVAGEKMRKILQFFTSNRVVAVIAGLMVTAVIQSSSACTVMVIGFINAGLLNLAQAIGIILGANIGTTVTAQMISFKLGGLALPAISIGLLVMFSKKPIVKGWGETILGFGILFLGMSMMSNELKSVGTFPSFVRFFQTFDCSPVNGYMPVWSVLGAVGIGIGMTVIIQSSSATIGIILALAASGLLNFYSAMPLELGATIGTTITAVLASLAANRYAKQAACAHVLFNVVKTVIMITLFYIPFPGTSIPLPLYLVNTITAGNVFAAVPQNLVRHIAMGHTLFNTFAVIMFLPFVGILALACRTILPVANKAQAKIKHLEPHLLDTPSVAIEQSIQSIRYMVKESWRMVSMAMNSNFMQGKLNEEQAKELETREQNIDELQNEVTDYLVQLTSRELTTPQAELIPLLMHCTNDAEKVADHTENILALTERLSRGAALSESGKDELRKVWKLLSDQAKNVIAALHAEDKANVKFAMKDEIKINKLVDEFEANHIERLTKGKCSALSGVIFIEMLSELEKIGDHLSNIAERAPDIQKHYFEIG